MTYRPLSTQNGLSTNFGQVNDMMRDLSKRERVEIFKDDSGTRRVLLGKGANGFYGLKVSPEGKDVYTATDDELIFNSNQNVFKIVASGTLSVSGSYSQGVGSIQNYVVGSAFVQHDLGYCPALLIYADPDSVLLGPQPVCDGSLLNSGFTADFSYTLTHRFFVTTFSLSADIVYNANVVSGTHSGTVSRNYKYYLLQETSR